MAPALDKLFLVIAIIAMPNLYYIAQYNVPLMLFCYGVWQTINYRPITMYLIIISWIVDLYCLIKTITQSQQPNHKPRIVLILQITIFILKIIAVIVLIIFDRASAQAIQPKKILDNFNHAIHDEPTHLDFHFGEK